MLCLLQSMMMDLRYGPQSPMTLLAFDTLCNIARKEILPLPLILNYKQPHHITLSFFFHFESCAPRYTVTCFFLLILLFIVGTLMILCKCFSIHVPSTVSSQASTAVRQPISL